MIDYRMKIEPARFTLSGQNIRLVHSVTTIVVKKNWAWIVLYGAITLCGLALSYFTSAWISVGVSFVVALLTLGIGLVMAVKVITITNEVR